MTDTRVDQAIDSPDDLLKFNQAELEHMLAEHEREIVTLTGRIEAGETNDWKRRARQALRHLRLHKDWIQRELLRRHIERKTKASEAHRELVRQAVATRAQDNDARLRRIAEANNETLRQMALFKEEVRKYVGDETYSWLWQRAEARIATEAAGGGR